MHSQKKTFVNYIYFFTFESFYLSTIVSAICFFWCIGWEVSVACMKAHSLAACTLTLADKHFL